MSLAYISNTLRTYFDTNYDSSIYTFENTVFVPPEQELWVRQTILPTNAEVTSLGSPCYREWGLLSFQIFEPKSKGTEQSERIVEIISNLFSSKRIDGVTLRLPIVTKLGLVKGSNFNQINLVFQYSFYHTE